MNENEVYRFVGAQWGRFQNDDMDRPRNYCSIFVLRQFGGKPSADRHFVGSKSEKLRCVDEHVFENIKSGDDVNVFFDQYGRVCALAIVK